MSRYTIAFAVGLVFIVGCGYGKVSPTTYEIAKSLYSISNRKLGDHLHLAKEQIVKSRENGDISDKEAKWLNAIVEHAEQERWEKAMNSARRIMEDQVSG